ncbi:hypothetical protein BO70DRAFT_382623 [Aspergillus heteromorphus CBS 117.55]|uniref:Rhodopsin domain-containing protein n=1 Tax=Aspergillus heteromorphus CBS 117.55 TaxID=1448321 RepID=A0A317V6D1_9EURO|nr:uncharacterized protein BO70DRAFT_382623 [Aspergillus heteromorphus CBS 117.55]PWY69079.1 hypothetical protein BO70DRAFT_382623 [Aspergillus heteromorphus CBS 117.55]
MATDRSLEVRAVAAVFLTLAAVTTILRCYVRLVIVKAFGWDDTIMVVAMLFYAMFCGCMIGGSIYGTGKHLIDLSNEQRTTAMEYWFLCDIGYALASILCKVSVSIFILRVTINRIHQIVIGIVGGIVIAAGFTFFIMLLVQCHPLSYFWTRLASNPNTGTCINIDIVIGGLYAFSAASALFDLTIGILPIMLVRKLKMRRDVKIAVAGLLSMACVASIAVIVRIPYINTLHSKDFLYATTPIAVWSNIETGLGIFAGSLATLRPLLRQFHPSTGPGYPSPWPSSRGGGKRSRSMPLHSLETPIHDASRLHTDERLYNTTIYSVEPGERRESGEDSADQSPILPKWGGMAGREDVERGGGAGGINVVREVVVVRGE